MPGTLGTARRLPCCARRLDLGSVLGGGGAFVQRTGSLVGLRPRFPPSFCGLVPLQLFPVLGSTVGPEPQVFIGRPGPGPLSLLVSSESLWFAD